MITEDKKEEIREAADLVEVVGDYVRLKRTGHNFVGLCPFHDEKTPSFNVTPRMGIYKCFGCGVSGDVFSFVMEMEGVGFQEALRTLAERYGISLPDQFSSDDDNEKHKEREGIYHALRFAGLYFFRQLRESDEAQKAREYLEGRGYDGGIIKKFGLGYGSARGDARLNEAKKEGIEEEYLLKADLIKQSQRHDGYYDTHYREPLVKENAFLRARSGDSVLPTFEQAPSPTAGNQGTSRSAGHRRAQS
jgi:DNA primase